MTKIVDTTSTLKEEHDIESQSKHDTEHGQRMPFTHRRPFLSKTFSFQSQGFIGLFLQILLLGIVAVFFFGVFVVHLLGMVFLSILNAFKKHR